jgi:single-strand DNA-binding protein
MRVGTDPDLRFSPNGLAICKVRAVASSRREEPKGSGNWVDDKSAWLSVTAFGPKAENMAATVHKGMLVLVDGRLSVEEWESGEKKGTSVEVLVDTIGPSLSYATAEVSKVEKGGGAQPQSSPARPAQSAAPQSDEPPF